MEFLFIVFQESIAGWRPGKDVQPRSMRACWTLLLYRDEQLIVEQMSEKDGSYERKDVGYRKLTSRHANYSWSGKAPDKDLRLSESSSGFRSCKLLVDLHFLPRLPWLSDFFMLVLDSCEYGK